jgi:tetratricopeptide (TPR) repeat protein
MTESQASFPPADAPETIPFLDVPTLLEQSQPAPRANWFWYGVGVFLLIVLASAYANTLGPEASAIVRALSLLTFVGLIVGMSVATWVMVRRQREEQTRLDAIEELVALRRWPQAALVLEHMLSVPTRTPSGRVQALLYLATVLSRYHRFDDAIAVHNHLLDNYDLDQPTAHAVRLGRAMAMLREDHLFDADRAIAELRRRRNSAAREDEAAGGDDDTQEAADDAASSVAVATSMEIKPGDSAGLALIEIYRDVKTGHPAEAIELFAAKLPLLRKQLGHRVGDAYALLAKAHDLLSQPAEAQAAFEKATLLAPFSELLRRYPEIQSLSAKYRVAAAPAEAA